LVCFKIFLEISYIYKLFEHGERYELFDERAVPFGAEQNAERAPHVAVQLVELGRVALAVRLAFEYDQQFTGN
jgi:hypothetical protein